MFPDYEAPYPGKLLLESLELSLLILLLLLGPKVLLPSAALPAFFLERLLAESASSQGVILPPIYPLELASFTELTYKLNL